MFNTRPDPHAFKFDIHRNAVNGFNICDADIKQESIIFLVADTMTECTILSDAVKRSVARGYGHVTFNVVPLSTFADTATHIALSLIKSANLTPADFRQMVSGPIFLMTDDISSVPDEAQRIVLGKVKSTYWGAKFGGRESAWHGTAAKIYNTVTPVGGTVEVLTTAYPTVANLDNSDEIIDVLAAEILSRCRMDSVSEILNGINHLFMTNNKIHSMTLTTYELKPDVTDDRVVVKMLISGEYIKGCTDTFDTGMEHSAAAMRTLRTVTCHPSEVIKLLNIITPFTKLTFTEHMEIIDRIQANIDRD